MPTTIRTNDSKIDAEDLCRKILSDAGLGISIFGEGAIKKMEAMTELISAKGFAKTNSSRKKVEKAIRDFLEVRLGYGLYRMGVSTTRISLNDVLQSEAQLVNSGARRVEPLKRHLENLLRGVSG